MQIKEAEHAAVTAAEGVGDTASEGFVSTDLWKKDESGCEDAAAAGCLLETLGAGTDC